MVNEWCNTDRHTFQPEQAGHFATCDYLDSHAVGLALEHSLALLALEPASFGVGWCASDFGHTLLLKEPDKWHLRLKTASFSIS